MRIARWEHVDVEKALNHTIGGSPRYRLDSSLDQRLTQAMAYVPCFTISHRLLHPFADGNGRAGRALALWELYRRGFDSHHIFSVDEYYWEDRPGYYAALDAVRLAGEDLSGWLEYSAEGLRQTLERTWLRVQALAVNSSAKLVLRPKQALLLRLLRDHRSMTPAALWAALGVSRQGAMDLLNPLLEAGLVERIGPALKAAARPARQSPMTADLYICKTLLQVALWIRLSRSFPAFL